MATYYKGKLFLNSELSDNSCLLGSSDFGNFYCSDGLKEYYFNLNNDERNILNRFLIGLHYTEYEQNIYNQKIIDIFKKMCKI